MSGYEFFELNQYSITVTKNLMRVDIPVSQNEAHYFQNPNLGCHGSWLEFIQITVKNNDLIHSDLTDLLACSSVQMRMLRKLYPNNLELSTLAAQLYPNETSSLYWLLQASDPAISIDSKPIIEKILQIKPRDGLAWRYLGIILIREGDILAAIEAHINCCNYGDPGANGCYNAGRLLEQEGRYEEAITFYKRSYHEPYRVNADRLEIELKNESSN